MQSGVELLCDMRNNLNAYDKQEQSYILEDWFNLIKEGLAKATIINNQYSPYIQYPNGIQYWSPEYPEKRC